MTRQTNLRGKPFRAPNRDELSQENQPAEQTKFDCGHHHPEIHIHPSNTQCNQRTYPHNPPIAPQQSSTTIKSKRPPTPYEKVARKRITTPKQFAKLHRERDKEIQKHIEKPRKGSTPLPEYVQDQLEPAAAKFLHATNGEAKIAFANIATKHIGKLVNDLGKDTQYFFVTLASKRYAVPLKDAPDFDPKSLKAWASQKFEGRNFIGMVEAAHYPNLGLIQGRTDQAVSWHVHLVVWGIPEHELKAIIDAANARDERLIPTMRPAHYKAITQDEVIGKTLYMMKAAIKEAFVYPKAIEVMDLETGEVTKVKTDRWKHKKRPYRRAGLAKMTLIMANQRIDRLIFGGRDGRKVCAAIRAEALRPLQRHERQKQPLIAFMPERRRRK